MDKAGLYRPFTRFLGRSLHADSRAIIYAYSEKDKRHSMSLHCMHVRQTKKGAHSRQIYAAWQEMDWTIHTHTHTHTRERERERETHGTASKLLSPINRVSTINIAFAPLISSSASSPTILLGSKFPHPNLGGFSLPCKLMAVKARAPPSLLKTAQRGASVAGRSQHG